MVAGAYDLSLDSRAWFARAVAAFRGQLDEGLGVWGAIVERDTGKVRHWQADGAHPANLFLMRAGIAAGFLRYVPSGFAAVSAVGMVGASNTARLLTPVQRLFPAQDSGVLWGPDEAGLMITFGAPRQRPRSPEPFEHKLAKNVLPHFAAALRLRRSLTGLSLETPSAEAVFEPDGRCLNAQGMAQAASSREILRSRVVKQECRRVHSESETEAPRDALLEGRWSLVDRFDAHGRRYIVAYRNPPGILDPRRLTVREREVAARIATGMHHKAIASELGISPSTVASVAAQVIKKLGLDSTRQLPLFWRDAGGSAVPLGRGELMAIHGHERLVPVERLTPAERAVLGGVILGQSDRDIARARGTSVRTVAKQIATLLRKFRVSGRGELAARGLELAED